MKSSASELVLTDKCHVEVSVHSSDILVSKPAAPQILNDPPQLKFSEVSQSENHLHRKSHSNKQIYNIDHRGRLNLLLMYATTGDGQGKLPKTRARSYKTFPTVSVKKHPKKLGCGLCICGLCIKPVDRL